MEFHTSDMHFSHIRIIEICRPQFRDVDHMNETMIERWNGKVSPADTVWVHGDGWMGRKDESLRIIEELNGRIILIVGNHDAPHPAYDKRQWKRDEWAQRYLDAGVSEIRVDNVVFHKIGGETVMMSHFPYEGDHTEDERYGEYRPENIGLTLIHGHVHDAWKVRRTSDWRRTLMVNVGVDVWDFTPVSAETLADFIKEQDT